MPDQIKREGDRLILQWHDFDTGDPDKHGVLIVHLVAPNKIWLEMKSGPDISDAFYIGSDYVFVRSYGPHLHQPKK